MCKYTTREELEKLFGDQVNFSPEEEAEAERRWLERGLADGSIQVIEGVNLFEI